MGLRLRSVLGHDCLPRRRLNGGPSRPTAAAPSPAGAGGAAGGRSGGAYPRPLEPVPRYPYSHPHRHPHRQPGQRRWPWRRSPRNGEPRRPTRPASAHVGPGQRGHPEESHGTELEDDDAFDVGSEGGDERGESDDDGQAQDEEQVESLTADAEEPQRPRWRHRRKNKGDRATNQRPPVATWTEMSAKTRATTILWPARPKTGKRRLRPTPDRAGGSRPTPRPSVPSGGIRNSGPWSRHPSTPPVSRRDRRVMAAGGATWMTEW